MSYKKYIPKYREVSFKDIDFNHYYSLGYRNIYCDLDNTLVTYSEKEPSKELLTLISSLKERGFSFTIVSNSSKKRVYPFARDLNVKYLHNANKPFTYKGRKLYKEKAIFIGDQLLTDIVFANKLKIDSILVNSIDESSELLRTKINRKREARILEKIKSKDIEAYKKIVGEVIE